jgi:hypothetical protein
MERSENPGRHRRFPDCAEPVIVRRFAPTRWLHRGYESSLPLPLAQESLPSGLTRGSPPSTERGGWAARMRSCVNVLATKQSILPLRDKMDCFASLAMTAEGSRHTLTRHRPA